MRFQRILLSVIAGVSSLGLAAQSYDEQLSDAIGRQDWFALDSIHSALPIDSINPFLEVFSRCLIGNRLNRPDVSIPAFQELLNTHSQSLDLGNLISSTFMFGMDLSRVGQNEIAASMTNAVLDSAKEYLDSVTIEQLTAQANRYAALAAYKPYHITFVEGQAGIIPFTIDKVGAEDKDNVLMRVKDGCINGMEAVITFDTGAGTNVMSPEMAEKYNLIPLEGATLSVEGMAKRSGYVAIAKEMNLGNIIITDVPFTVVDLSTGNEEADQYIDCFNIVVGSELMLQLKDVTLNFQTNQITFPTIDPSGPVWSDAKPNICFSSGMNLFCKGVIHGETMLMNMDSGDSSYGSLDYSFFERNKEYVTENGTLDSTRSAGVAGVNITESYCVPDMKIALGGNTMAIPEMNVKAVPGATMPQIECNIGLKTLMLFDFIRFNLVDFVLTTGISNNDVIR